ncbi:MAG: DUF4062 domain-containing protein [Planctomycetaceae bacterium]
MMDYKAFVSSTFLDLQEHRAHVIRELRKAGFFVDPMEEWTSAAQEPKVLSVNRLEGCTLCVLLVARRRGHVPTGDELSITQQEVQNPRNAFIKRRLTFLTRQARSDSAMSSIWADEPMLSMSGPTRPPAPPMAWHFRQCSSLRR